MFAASNEHLKFSGHWSHLHQLVASRPMTTDFHQCGHTTTSAYRGPDESIDNMPELSSSLIEWLVGNNPYSTYDENILNLWRGKI